MPTRSGWSALAGAAALVAGGRVLGAFELYLIGVGTAALLAVCLLWVLVVPVGVDITRAVLPSLVPFGGEARVELELHNPGRRPTPVIELFDPVGVARRARVRVAPVEAGSTALVAYRLPTDRRGRLPIGPLVVTVRDPFGLCARRRRTVEPAEALVLPQVVALAGIGEAHDQRNASSGHRIDLLGTAGGEFHALRAYVPGDDLRRVHWPSLARTDELTVRQLEFPRPRGVTVVLDTAAEHYDDERFERAVSAAASLLVAGRHAGASLRLVTTDGADSGRGEGPGHLDALLATLAHLQPSPSAQLAAVLAPLSSDGALVVEVVGDGIDPTGSRPGAGAAQATSPRPSPATRRSRATWRVAFVADATNGAPDGAPDGAIDAGGTRLLRVGPDEAFARRWNDHAVPPQRQVPR